MIDQGIWTALDEKCLIKVRYNPDLLRCNS